jgi:DNA-directed RNA polymerase specialized sigma24 family protein
VSTRWEPKRRGLVDQERDGKRLAGRRDPAQEVAIVAAAKRDLLLRVHGHRLRREDLEDCYSQAILEMVVAVRGGRAFVSRLHLERAIEQRFLSRVQDRRRAILGRSPMQAALEEAEELGSEERGGAIVIDRRAEPERVVILRQELDRIQALAGHLTPEQRMVIATQVGLGMSCEEFCQLHEWSSEKYRKVAQRGRARLKQLMVLEEQVVPVRTERAEITAGTDL